MSKRERILFVVVLVLSAILVFGGREVPEVSAKDATGDINLYKELKTFSDVLSIVQRDYVREVNSKQLVEGAIKGMLATLDPHSGYLDPDFYQDLQVQTKGEFGGLGIEITIKDGLLVVVAPMEDSPAEKAGIRAGDSIVKIEGKFTKEFSLVDAVKRLRGPKGSPINISVYRKGQPDLIDFTLIRDKITVRSVKGRYLSDGFAYVRISQFMEKTADDLRKALKLLADKSEDQQLHGLVLDLRNNPGGLLTQAIMVSDMFLDEGVIVYTDGRVENQKQKFFAHGRATERDYPIVVLVNGGSASASEIVAGALKDHGRALILGTQTFGKGSVQTITPLENGGAVTLTTALYYTKSGNSIQARGVTPDIELAEGPEPSVDNLAEEKNKAAIMVREEDLPGAIGNPSDKKSRESGEPGVGRDHSSAGSPLQQINKTPTGRADLSSIDPETIAVSEWMQRDRQFQRAFDLLKTFNIFKSHEN